MDELKRQDDGQNRQIRSILFDLGNVLVFYDSMKAARAFAKLLQKPETDIWAAFFQSDVEKAYTEGKISSEEFVAQVNRFFGSRLDCDTFARHWNEIFTANSEMIDLVAALEKHYPLYLISNTNYFHFEYIKKNFPVLQHFKRLFPSHEVGFRKPNPEIFRHVLAEIALQPPETVFIDDMPEFIASARALGIHTIQFESRKRLEPKLRALGIRW